jgi:hypothetical protein
VFRVVQGGKIGNHRSGFVLELTFFVVLRLEGRPKRNEEMYFDH